MAHPAAASDSGHSNFLDLATLGQTPLGEGPFPYLIVPGFILAAARAALSASFPKIDAAGSFPIEEIPLSGEFRAFLDELKGPEFRAAIERKFGVELTGRPTMITVRGQARAKDGRIHNDSRTKLITVLVYMNEAWEAEGGRLRLLRSPTDLDAVIAEVPPHAGTLLAFRVTDNSWHGHVPAQGPRRVVQLNWVESDKVVRRERARHGLSARVKRFLSVLRPPKM